jgi:hypothetical protein
MGEKAADQHDGQAGAAPLDGVQYCSEHPYRPGAAAVAVAGGGICVFCLQEKLGRLVSSSKPSPFFPLSGHPPPSASPSSPPSFRHGADEPPPPLRPSGASRKFIPFHWKKASSSSSATTLRRSKSVAPRPEEQFPYSSASSSESPRKKSFWSFLYLSSSSAYAHQATASTPYASGAAAARRVSVSVPVASAAWASRGGTQQPRAATLEAIGGPEESPSQVSSSSSFGRNVARPRSVGCGSRSFSADFLDRLSFGDCTLRRVESHREPKPSKMRRTGADDVYEHHQHRIKCAGFFGGMGPAGRGLLRSL